MLYLSFDKDGYFEAVTYSAEERPGTPGVEALGDLDCASPYARAYKWDGERLVPDKKRLSEILEQEEREKRDAQIGLLKKKLADTDYAVIKIAEGAATVEEYADVIAQRRAWRTEIGALEDGTQATVGGNKNDEG